MSSQESPLQRYQREKSERATAAAPAPAEKILVAAETKMGGGSQIPPPVTPPAALIAEGGNSSKGLCKFFREGNCTRGSACKFSHGTPSTTNVSSQRNFSEKDVVQSQFYGFLRNFLSMNQLDFSIDIDSLRYSTYCGDFDKFNPEQQCLLSVYLSDEIYGTFEVEDAYFKSKPLPDFFNFREYSYSVDVEITEHRKHKSGPIDYNGICDRAFEKATIKLSFAEAMPALKISKAFSMFLTVPENCTNTVLEHLDETCASCECCNGYIYHCECTRGNKGQTECIMCYKDNDELNQEATEEEYDHYDNTYGK
jgi:hypothetical protein